MQGLQRLCCLKLFEQFVGPGRQLFVRTEYYYFDFSLSGVVRKYFC